MTEANVGPLLVHPRPDDGRSVRTDAEISGTLVLEFGCLRLVKDDELAIHYPIAWPFGTSWDPAAQEVRLPDGSPVVLGAQLVGSGAYVSIQAAERVLDLDSDALRESCGLKPSEEVAITNNFATAIQVSG